MPDARTIARSGNLNHLGSGIVAGSFPPDELTCTTTNATRVLPTLAVDAQVMPASALRPGCAYRRATLGGHVLGVVRRRPDEQVVGADAGWVVAAVADVQSMGDRPDERLEGDAMGASTLEVPVSTARDRPSPFPAFTAESDLGHEPVQARASERARCHVLSMAHSVCGTLSRSVRMPRPEVCKTSITGSNPVVASTILSVGCGSGAVLGVGARARERASTPQRPLQSSCGVGLQRVADVQVEAHRDARVGVAQQDADGLDIHAL